MNKLIFTIDFYIQSAILIIGFLLGGIYFINDKEILLLLSVYGIGGSQFCSFLMKIMMGNRYNKTYLFKGYAIVLLVILFGIIVPYTLIFTLYFLLFLSPILAILYWTICYLDYQKTKIIAKTRMFNF